MGHLHQAFCIPLTEGNTDSGDHKIPRTIRTLRAPDILGWGIGGVIGEAYKGGYERVPGLTSV